MAVAKVVLLQHLRSGRKDHWEFIKNIGDPGPEPDCVQRQVRISVFYEKGEVNIFTGRPIQRGMHISIGPQESRNGYTPGVRITSTVLGSGMRGLLWGMPNKSPKQIAQVVARVDAAIPAIMRALEEAGGEGEEDEGFRAAIKQAREAVGHVEA